MESKVPPKCDECTSNGRCEAQEKTEENYRELHRRFAMMLSDIPGEYVFICKKCMRTAMSREGLYRITHTDGKTEEAFIVESVWCIAGCGQRWHRRQ